MSREVLYQNFLPTNYLEDLDDLDANVGNSYEVSSNSGSTSSSQSGDSSGLGSPSSYSAFSQVFRPKNLHIQQQLSQEIPEPTVDYNQNYSQFNDYLGLSKLLQNVKINEENPLLYMTNQQQISSGFHSANAQQNAQQNNNNNNNNHHIGHYDRQKLHHQKNSRRLSWESDGSDPALVMSPSRNSDTFNPYADFQSHNEYMAARNSGAADMGQLAGDSGFKQLPPPPPSWRLPKAMRDHIISGAYQQQLGRNHHEGPAQFKMPPPPSHSHHHHVPSSQVSPPPGGSHKQPPQMPGPQDLPISSSQPPMPGSMTHSHPVSQHPMGLQGGMLPPTRSSQQGGGGGGAPPLCCVFCRNNKESESVYTSHNLKDAEGRTVCPILRAYTCPICKANGDNSHTIKYCPENQNARYMQLPQHQPSQPPPVFRPPPPPVSVGNNGNSGHTSSSSHHHSSRGSGRMPTQPPMPPHHMSFTLPQVPTKIR